MEPCTPSTGSAHPGWADTSGRLDVIGDVHGRCEALRSLLEALGYREADGAYRHLERRAVFMGDLIDRGPDVAGALAVVQAMAAAGTAEVLLGNHELNLVAWFTPDGQGGFRRPHTEKNRKQVQGTLDAFAGDPSGMAQAIAWFRTLPIVLERGGARFIHACWHPPSLALLAGRNSLDALGWDREDFMASAEYGALEVLLKGPETPLPEGWTLPDSQGHKRPDARVRWWVDPAVSDLRAALLPDLPGLAGRPLPPEVAALMAPPPAGNGPVFIGHYQFTQPDPALHPQVICVDCPGAEGLRAYRWGGEREVRADRFV